jgi:hypothetical protein
MDKLEEALAFAQYQSTLNNQRQLLKQKFQDSIILAYNGGLFKVDPQFIAGLNGLDTGWLLDINDNPIKIEDMSQLIKDARALWAQAITTYGEAFNQLKTKRSVKAVVGL